MDLVLLEVFSNLNPSVTAFRAAAERLIVHFPISLMG